MFSIKKRLQKGELMVGTMISELRNPNIAYMLAQCGFNFFIIDNEHGAFNPETVSDMIAAARGAQIAPIVRIPEIRRETILKPLDSGAAGLLIPQVETAEQAEEIIFHAKYPPLGNRGTALRRAHSCYRKVHAGSYLQQANDETFIVVQAESPRAVENLEAIVSMAGIDAVLVGPFDLSVSLGIPGQVNHPLEVRTIGKILKICQKRKIIAGIHMFELPLLRKWVKKGMRFISYSSDVTFLADASAAGVAELKEAAAP
jgi:2-keto-3-deoxy-L-rhamnonate aldolase RhmA